MVLKIEGIGTAYASIDGIYVHLLFLTGESDSPQGQSNDSGMMKSIPMTVAALSL